MEERREKRLQETRSALEDISEELDPRMSIQGCGLRCRRGESGRERVTG
jgi:hypothetical protein